MTDETKCAGCCAHKPDYCYRCFDGVVEARDAARADAERLQAMAADADAEIVTMLKVIATAKSVVHNLRPAPDDSDPVWRLQARLDEYDALMWEVTR